jgi:glycine/D-amino acid oxidase-like deaminating enzyme
MPGDPQAFLIAGGGIGGLAAALGLARKGSRSVVLEQAPTLGEIGAGLPAPPVAVVGSSPFRRSVRPSDRPQFHCLRVARGLRRRGEP